MADGNRVRSAGQGLGHVLAAPDPAVKQYRDLFVHGLRYGWQHVERNGNPVQLAAAVVGTVDARSARTDGEQGVVRRLYAFYDYGKPRIGGGLSDALRACFLGGWA